MGGTFSSDSIRDNDDECRQELSRIESVLKKGNCKL
jgi:hypothetical protein